MLDLGVFLERVHGHVAAVAAVLAAAVGHFRGEAGVIVDPHRAQLRACEESTHGAAQAFGPDAGGEGVADSVGKRQGLGFIRKGLHGDDRAEDLVLHDFVLLADSGEHGGKIEAAGAIGRAAAEKDLGSGGAGAIDHGGDFVALRLRDQRTHIGFGREGIAEFYLLDFRCEKLQEPGGHGAVNDDARDGGAVLPGVVKGGTPHALRGPFEVGVFEDDRRGLSAKLEEKFFEGGRGGLLNFRAGDGRTGEGNGGNAGMLGERRTDRNAAAGDDVENAGREEAGGKRGQFQRGQRGQLGGFENHGVADGQGRGGLPDGDEKRVVPRSDGGDDAQRFAANQAGVAGKIFARGFALEGPGGAGEEAQIIDGKFNIVAGHAEGFANVLGFEQGQLLCGLLDAVRELEQESGARLRVARDQESKAAAAAATAAFTSASAAAGACAMGCAVAGLRMTSVAPSAAATHWPLMNILASVMVAPAMVALVLLMGRRRRTGRRRRIA